MSKTRLLLADEMEFAKQITITIKLGYNDHGCNEFAMDIKNFFSDFMSPKDCFHLHGHSKQMLTVRSSLI